MQTLKTGTNQTQTKNSIKMVIHASASAGDYDLAINDPISRNNYSSTAGVSIGNNDTVL